MNVALGQSECFHHVGRYDFRPGEHRQGKAQIKKKNAASAPHGSGLPLRTVEVLLKTMPLSRSWSSFLCAFTPGWGKGDTERTVQ